MNSRLLAVMVSFFLTLSSVSRGAEVIRITNGEWLPFFSQSLEGFGRPSMIVTDAFALEGIKVEYGFFPWKRSYVLSRNGVWNGTIGWPFSEERSVSHYYSMRPINSGDWVFFHRKSMKLSADSPDKLKAYTFGVTLGEWAMDGNDEFTKSLRRGKYQIQQAATDEQMFLMLVRGRIDVFPQQVDVGYHQISQLQKEGLMSHEEAIGLTHYPKPYRQMPLYLLLSKKIERNKMLMELFNRGMDRLHEMDRLD